MIGFTDWLVIFLVSLGRTRAGQTVEAGHDVQYLTTVGSDDGLGYLDVQQWLILVRFVV